MKITTTLLFALLVSTFSLAQEKEERKTGSFDAISIAVAADVYITKGNNNQVILEGDADDLENIITEVEDGRLKVRHENSSWWNGGSHDRITVYITTPELNGTNLSGSARVESKDLFVTSDFDVNVSGSGKIMLNIQAEDTDIDISGSGKVILTGTSGEADINISGSGDIDAENFKVANADINVMGSGNCTIYVTDRLDTKVIGSGNVTYAGNPSHVNNNTMGSGNVRKM